MRRDRLEHIATVIVILGLVFMLGVYCGVFYSVRASNSGKKLYLNTYGFVEAPTNDR